MTEFDEEYHPVGADVPRGDANAAPTFPAMVIETDEQIIYYAETHVDYIYMLGALTCAWPDMVDAARGYNDE